MNQLHDPVAISNWLGQFAPSPGATASDAANHDAWNKIIDKHLPGIRANRQAIKDDGYEPPSDEILTLASSFAEACRTQGVPAPQRAVPDGEGGISFERRSGSQTENIELSKDGTLERWVFVNSKLASRQKLL